MTAFAPLQILIIDLLEGLQFRRPPNISYGRYRFSQYLS